MKRTIHNRRRTSERQARDVEPDADDKAVA
jgi:hypothetical protein